LTQSSAYKNIRKTEAASSPEMSVSTKLHGGTSQTTAIFRNTDMTDSNLRLLYVLKNMEHKQGVQYCHPTRKLFSVYGSMLHENADNCHQLVYIPVMLYEIISLLTN
jgi:hypothetical protein